MRYRLFTLLLVLTILLTGCSGFDLVDEMDMGSKSDSEEPLEEPEEEKEPAMVINKEPVLIEEPEEIEEEEEDSFFGYVLSEEEKNDPNVICKETAKEGEVSFVFAGDINFDSHYANMGTYNSIGQGIAGVLNEELISEFNEADIAMINNEFPYSTRGTPTAGKKFTFRADPSMVENLSIMGIDIVSLANNHAYDHGIDALLDTFDTLDEAGIAYVGAGHNIEEAMTPVYFIAGGMKIAVVSATQIERSLPPDTKEATEDAPGVLRTLEPDKFLQVIKTAEENADLTICYVHWGAENTYNVDESQKELASAYVDAGADLIIGDHSHCLQGFEYVKGVPVIYSLGNFWFSSRDLDTGIVRAVLSEKEVKAVQFIPCRQQNCKTRLLQKGTDGDYERVLGVMAELSYDVSVDEDGIISNGAGNGVEPVAPRPLPNKSNVATVPAVAETPVATEVVITAE